ncbi:MAG: hypothetical protein BWY82_02330 [Verrucomicrobia bacterium ADurb.Bin474]|nr:MAG: hypothetical protein BWY82_02330 [Verrucomicrobia bacterium ADurb.Bin474]
MNHDDVTPAFHSIGCGAGVKCEIPRVWIQQFRFHVVTDPVDSVALANEDPDIEFKLCENRTQCYQRLIFRG